MLHDKTVMKAVASIKQRSERQNSLDVLSKTFVDPGVLIEIENTNHQILFGRRGTGKTHVLKMLQSGTRKNEGSFACYIDCRTLGSTAQYTDQSLSIKHRSYSLFRDILTEIHDVLLERLVETSPPNGGDIMAKLELFSSQISDPKKVIKSATVSENTKRQETHDESAGVGIAIAGRIGFDLSGKRSNNDEAISTSAYSVEFDDKALFLPISKSLELLVRVLGDTLFVLIDEWSSIPSDVQPYLAEFVKRGILPCSSVTLKIAAIEFRSNFSVPSGNGVVGIELGADMATCPSLDTFYYVGTREIELEGDFAEMLFRHISSELPFDYLGRRYHINDGRTLMHTIFDDQAFNTLAQAAEGVVRDLINVFVIAFSKVQKLHKPNSYEGDTRINRSVIYEAAKQWFDRDKLQGIGPELHEKFVSIVRHAISTNRSRYFVVPSTLEGTESLNKLVDMRVLHQSSNSFMGLLDGVQMYKIFNIDFGSYASLWEFDAKSKYRDMPFFDQSSFSKYPIGTEPLDAYLMDAAYLA